MNWHPGQITLPEARLLWRSGGDGRKLVCCFHGYEQDSRVYQLVFPDIPTDARVLSFDVPPFGGSAWLGDYKPLGEAFFTSLFEEILDQFQPDEVYLVGFSMGARWAMGLAALPFTEIKGLVLAAPTGGKVPWLHTFGTRTWAGRATATYLMNNPALIRYPLERYHRYRPMPTDLYHYLHTHLKTPHRMLQVKQVWELYDKMATPWQALGKMEVPVHLIWGRYDRIIPFRHSSFWLNKIPHAKLHPLPAAHLLLDQEPGACRKIIQQVLSEGF
ncbi:MAG: alpha/beta hydrolase [Bacteroidota bacterium]